MRAAARAVVAALGCFLLAASPARAEQAADPLADLIAAGAPLVASVPADSGAAGAVPRPHAAASVPGARPHQSGVAPAVEIPAIPNPRDLLGGLDLDPRAWAGAFLDAAVDTLGRAVLGAVRGFTDWALGLGGSSLNFVTRTPEAGTYESTAVRSLWELSRGIANSALALIVMWGGFNLILKQHLRSPYDGAMELLPRAALAALALNLTIEFARLAVDVNNALTSAVGHPSEQRTGLGTALLRPMLMRIDEDALPSFLDTSAPDNLGYYERFGFRVTGESKLPNGLPLWGMTRPPRPQ